MSHLEAAFDAAFSHVLGHQAVSVSIIGIRAGLFAAIQDRGPISAPNLAEVLGFDEHLVRVWCRAAFAFEFLDTYQFAVMSCSTSAVMRSATP